MEESICERDEFYVWNEIERVTDGQSEGKLPNSAQTAGSINKQNQAMNVDGTPYTRRSKVSRWHYW